MAEEKTTELTVDGYTFEADLDAVDDVETLDILDGIEEKPSKMIHFVKLCVGEDGYNKMKDHFVKKGGKFKISTLILVVEKISNSFDPKEQRSQVSSETTSTKSKPTSSSTTT